MLDAHLRKKVLDAQRNELTEHYFYLHLAKKQKKAVNRRILREVSAQELQHYHHLQKHSGEDSSPKKLKFWWYHLLALVFGITFSIKLMEKGERKSQSFYRELSRFIPSIKHIFHEEEEHEKKLINLLEEERLNYVGSIVLGLNDALVELTGALAGFTLALGNTTIVAMVGLITGIAAALSMAASEYQSRQAENDPRPVLAAFYTGFVYSLTVIILVTPYLFFTNIYWALAGTLILVLLIILVFTYYVSIAKDLPFWKRFLKMTLISFGVAAITFGIGYLVQIWFGISI